MTAGEIHERIEEFRRIKKNSGNDEIALAEVALFVEDVFGLILTDEEIIPEKLGSFESLEKHILEKIGLSR